MPTKDTRTLIDRLCDGADLSGGLSACWPWQRSIGSHGYGQIAINRRPALVHRTMWQEVYGPIPDGIMVCHTCDNRPCINPRHLFLGTHRDNMEDAKRKGRLNNKLTSKDIPVIRSLLAAGVFQKHIAWMFGVDDSIICEINTGKIWKHD